MTVKRYKRIFCLCLCVMFSFAIYVVYSSSSLSQGFYNRRPKIAPTAGTKLLNKVSHKAEITSVTSTYASERQMAETRSFPTEDKVIQEHASMPEQDHAYANKIKSERKPTLIPASPALTDEMPINKTTTKLTREYIDQLLRVTIKMHHLNYFIKPENEKCERRLPICIVIGVYKAGTKEILDFLRLHPHIEVFPAGMKNSYYEMSYFRHPSVYEKGDEWLKSLMPCSYSNQVTLFKNAGYFHDAAVPERIKRFNESLKFILMVRDPFARAVSDYMFSLKKYLPRDFSSVVLNEDGSAVQSSASPIRHSVYDESMTHWLKFFNLSQFLVIESNEFKHDPVSVLRKTEQFLGLENYIKPNMFVFNKEKGFYCIQSNLTDTGMACFPESRGKKKQITVAQRTESRLREYFKPKSERFFKIIGKTFDWE